MNLRMFPTGSAMRTPASTRGNAARSTVRRRPSSSGDNVSELMSPTMDDKSRMAPSGSSTPGRSLPRSPKRSSFIFTPYVDEGPAGSKPSRPVQRLFSANIAFYYCVFPKRQLLFQELTCFLGRGDVCGCRKPGKVFLERGQGKDFIEGCIKRVDNILGSALGNHDSHPGCGIETFHAKFVNALHFGENR